MRETSASDAACDPLWITPAEKKLRTVPGSMQKASACDTGNERVINRTRSAVRTFDRHEWSISIRQQADLVSHTPARTALGRVEPLQLRQIRWFQQMPASGITPAVPGAVRQTDRPGSRGHGNATMQETIAARHRVLNCRGPHLHRDHGDDAHRGHNERADGRGHGWNEKSTERRGDVQAQHAAPRDRASLRPRERQVWL